MSRKTLIALALTLAATANAAPLPLADDIPAGKDGVMTYIGKESKTTAPLALTLDPEGGETVATIPQGGKATVLLHDGKGHTLVANHFGLTGWAQPASSAENNDDFPALKKSELREKGSDPIFSLHYLPALGKTMHGTYNKNDEGQLVPYDPKAENSDLTYDHLLDTALKAGGETYHVYCSTGMSDDYGCNFLSEGSNLDNTVGIAGQDFYIPGNGYVYTDFDDSGSSLHRKRQKWAFDGKDVKEVAQPYYYLGIKSTYHGDDNDSTGKLDTKATLALTDANGQKVATLKAGDKFTLVLADARYDCPADDRTGSEDYPICQEARVLVKTADGTLGWITASYNERTKDRSPRIDGLHPLAG